MRGACVCVSGLSPQGSADVRKRGHMQSKRIKIAFYVHAMPIILGKRPEHRSESWLVLGRTYLIWGPSNRRCSDKTPERVSRGARMGKRS
jgi:hypothetical protein